MAAASIESSKSIVPMTCERLAGSVTYGVAYDVLGPAVERVRGRRGARPPFEAALAVDPVQLLGHQEEGGDGRGVVRLVLRELSIAVGRSKNSGTWRPLAGDPSARSRAGGDMIAIHRPPSEAKHFCGAK